MKPTTNNLEWEERIKKTSEHIGVISIGCLKTLIGDIRRSDEEELIKMLPEFKNIERINRQPVDAGFNDCLYLVNKLIKEYFTTK